MNCEEYKLIMEFKEVGNVDLSPICLTAPLLVVKNDNKLYLKYITPEKILTFEHEGVDNSLEDFMLFVSDKICKDNVTKEDLIDILKSSEKYYNLENFLEEVKLRVSTRFDLLDIHKNKVLEDLEKKDYKKAGEDLGILLKIVKVNGVDINLLKDLAGEKEVKAIEEDNNLYLEFANSIFNKLKED